MISFQVKINFTCLPTAECLRLNNYEAIENSTEDMRGEIILLCLHIRNKGHLMKSSFVKSTSV